MTTTALVPVFTGDTGITLCNARDLHTVLENGDHFATWIKERIEKYGFTEGEDYFGKSRNRSDGRPGRQRTDYHLTLDMAKELAMVENNDKGRQVRRYFIAVEKAARAQVGAGETAKLPALPPPRRIRKREDLSFTARDSEGRMLNWFVPSRTNQWHEHVGIGEEWFAEVVELAKHDPSEAFDALRFAGDALVRTWNWGHETGFMTAFARWAVAAMIEHKGVAPSVPFKLPALGIPPREGFEHYRQQAAPLALPAPTMSKEEREAINKKAWAETAECSRECFKKRRAEMIDAAH